MNNRKKILFVNNNMKIGGVQKALVEVLWAIHEDYDVTLLLFCKSGSLMEQLPENVRVIETSSDYRYLAISQRECQGIMQSLIRGGYTLVSRTLGLSWVTRRMDRTVGHDQLGAFDYAISFLHCAREKSMYGGAAEYVLHNVTARKKACYIHCDYLHSRTYSGHSQDIYSRYDRILCVSASVKKRFLELLPALAPKTVVVNNPLNKEKIRHLAAEAPFVYESDGLNVLTVARLSPEKGIDRILHAMARVKGFRYYILGPGALRGELEQIIRENSLEQRVSLLGEDANPYRYMQGADLLAVPSRHEAAPVVFQEAAALGLPVLTTRTLSAEEMVPATHGIVVDNTEEALTEALEKLTEQPQQLRQWKEKLRRLPDPDEPFPEQFHELLYEDES